MRKRVSAPRILNGIILIYGKYISIYTRLTRRLVPLALLLFLSPMSLAALDFALGPIAGEATGLSARLRFDELWSIRGALAWDSVSPGGLGLRADALLNPFPLFQRRLDTEAESLVRADEGEEEPNPALEVEAARPYRISGSFGLGFKLIRLAGDGRYGSAPELWGLSVYLPFVALIIPDAFPMELFMEALAGCRFYPNWGFEPSVALGFHWRLR